MTNSCMNAVRKNGFLSKTFSKNQQQNINRHTWGGLAPTSKIDKVTTIQKLVGSSIGILPLQVKNKDCTAFFKAAK